MPKPTTQSNLYNSVVAVVQEYLGPASHRFVDRQIRNHLHKEPKQLEASDLSTLVDWIKIATAFLTNDANLVYDLGQDILQLQQASAKPKLRT